MSAVAKTQDLYEYEAFKKYLLEEHLPYRSTFQFTMLRYWIMKEGFRVSDDQARQALREVGAYQGWEDHPRRGKIEWWSQKPFPHDKGHALGSRFDEIESSVGQIQDQTIPQQFAALQAEIQALKEAVLAATKSSPSGTTMPTPAPTPAELPITQQETRKLNMTVTDLKQSVEKLIATEERRMLSDEKIEKAIERWTQKLAEVFK